LLGWDPVFQEKPGKDLFAGDQLRGLDCWAGILYFRRKWGKRLELGKNWVGRRWELGLDRKQRKPE